MGRICLFSYFNIPFMCANRFPLMRCCQIMLLYLSFEGRPVGEWARRVMRPLTESSSTPEVDLYCFPITSSDSVTANPINHLEKPQPEECLCFTPPVDVDGDGDEVMSVPLHPIHQSVLHLINAGREVSEWEACTGAGPIILNFNVRSRHVMEYH